MRLESKSRTFFEKAIKTLPSNIVPIIYSTRLDLCLNGIEIPCMSKEVTRDDKYIRQCKRDNIIPYSGIKLIYHRNSETFPFEIETRYSDCNLINGPKERTEELISYLIKGGKINKIRVEIEDPSQIGAFKYFKDNGLLDKLLEDGYQVTKGDIIMGQKNQKRDKDTNVQMVPKGDLYILKLNQRIDTKDSEEMIEWFNKLKR